MSYLSAMVCSITIAVIAMPSLYLAIEAITKSTTAKAISYFHLRQLQYQWIIASSDFSTHFAVSFAMLV